jgi:hypothetical protein
MLKPDNEKPFVLLEGVEHGNRFFTTNRRGEDPTKSATGETWYRILSYASSVDEAQQNLRQVSVPAEDKSK